MDEVMQASDEAFATGHLIYYHHVLPRDAILVGGLSAVQFPRLH